MSDREEAIERLAEVQLDGGAYADSFANLSAVCKAIYDPPFGWTLGACATLRDKLVDLLGAAGTPESAESGASGGGDPDDSREKLEADVRKRYTHTVSTAMWPPSANKHTDMVSVSIDTVLGWLDRQAAITEREVKLELLGDSEQPLTTALMASVASNLAEKNGELREQVDELTAERDELERANERQARKITAVCDLNDVQSKRIKELEAERDELKRQLDTMRDVTREFRDERDELKVKLRECDEQRIACREERDSLMAKLREIVGDGCSS